MYFLKGFVFVLPQIVTRVTCRYEKYVFVYEIVGSKFLKSILFINTNKKILKGSPTEYFSPTVTHSKEIRKK